MFGGGGEGEKGTFVEVRPSCERRWACSFVVRSIVFSGRALEKRFFVWQNDPLEDEERLWWGFDCLWAGTELNS